MLPAIVHQHTATVTPYLGISGTGEDLYGAPIVISGFCEDKVRQVRDHEGAEVVSSSTFYTDPGPSVPPRSEITLPSGRVSRVIIAADFDGGDLPVPSHLEISVE